MQGTWATGPPWREHDISHFVLNHKEGNHDTTSIGGDGFDHRWDFLSGRIGLGGGLQWAVLCDAVVGSEAAGLDTLCRADGLEQPGRVGPRNRARLGAGAGGDD